MNNNFLLVDGNWFLHSRLFVLPWKKDSQLLATKEEEGQLMRKLMIDFASEIRKIKHIISGVMVAVDDKSWRKDLFSELSYKGTRVHDDSINWDAVYRVYDAFQSILMEHGVIVQKIPGAEADDLIFHWSTLLNNNGQSCIILTGDRDLIQLVDYNEATGAQTIWYASSKSTIMAHTGFMDKIKPSTDLDLKINQNDIFNVDGFNLSTGEIISDRLYSWILDQKLEVIEVDSDLYVLSKILQGDKSDNIPSVVVWNKENKNGKIVNYSISDKIANKVIEDFIQKLNQKFTVECLFDPIALKDLVNSLHHIIGKMGVLQIESRLNQNITLILLHNNVLPDGIQKAMYHGFEKTINEGANLENLSKMKTILEGTNWTSDETPVEFDPFKELKKEETISINRIESKELF